MRSCRHPANTATATAIPKTPPSSRIMLLAPAALPTSSMETEPTTEFCADGNRHRDSDAGDDRRQQELGVGEPGSAINAIQPMPEPAATIRRP